MFAFNLKASLKVFLEEGWNSKKVWRRCHVWFMNQIKGRGIRRLLGSNQDTINCEFIKEVSLNF